MRKLLIIAAVALVALSASAQKGNINKAKNKALSDVPDFPGAKALIEEALVHPETKDLADTWYAAAQIYSKIVDSEFAKEQLGQKFDAVNKGESAIKAYNCYLKAYELDFLPNAKGQIKPKYAKKIPALIASYYKDNTFINYGVDRYSDKKYEKAIESFDIHCGIPDLEIIQANAKEPLVKDTIFYQIRYYTGVCYQLNNDNAGAARVYEDIKDNPFGYESNRIYQYLFEIYKNDNDTANFVRILEDGFKKFPAEQFFLGNLINHFIFSGESEKAIDYLNAAIAQEPNNEQYYFVKGNVMEVLQKTDEAMIFFNKAIELKPDFADAYIGKGRIIYNEGSRLENLSGATKDNKEAKTLENQATEKFKESLQFFEKAAEINKEDVDNLRTLRSLYYRFGMDSQYQEVDKLIKSL